MKRFSTVGRMVTAALVAAASVVVAAPSPAGADAHSPRANGMIVVASAQSFEATWAALLGALDANPNIDVLAEVDHAAAAASVGLDLEPNRVVLFGNPALGSPVMRAGRTVGLDLPQKIQVWQDGDDVFVGFNAPEYLDSRHETGGVPELDVVAGALANLTATAAGIDVADVPARARGLADVRAARGVRTVTSDADFETTWQRLLDAIDASPASIFTTVDHGAASDGLLRPTRLVVFGNPNLGTPLMQRSATAGIDLPLKILVWEAIDGTTKVSANRPTFLRERHGLFGVASLRNVAGATNNFVATAAGFG